MLAVNTSMDAASAAHPGKGGRPGSGRVRREVPRLAFNQMEAAEALGISVDHFERHVKAELPVVYSGSLKLYPRTGLERWLERNATSRGRRVA
jgi:hypothetical protein